MSLTVFELWSGHEYTIVEFQRGITPKLYRQELRSLCFAGRLMMLYICMKFRENILNDFQVIKRTRLRDGLTDRRTDIRGKKYFFPPPPVSETVFFFFFVFFSRIGTKLTSKPPTLPRPSPRAYYYLRLLLTSKTTLHKAKYLCFLFILMYIIVCTSD